MKKHGFTLSEVLITLAILGIVAVLAIPILMQAQQDKEVAAKLSLAQSLLANATEMAELNTGKIANVDFSNRTAKDIYNDYYKNTLKITKFCSEDSSGDCWTPTKDFFSKTLAAGGNTFGITGTVHNGFILQDGMNVTITKVDELDDKFGIELNDEAAVVFMVDINGSKAPNSMGQDVFAFILDKNGKIIPAGTDNNSSNCNRGCDLDDDYWDCSAKVLKEEKRDYI